MNKNSKNEKRPVIAITMGDAAGIGPEVVAKALLSEEIYDICRPLVIGESAAMQKALDLVKGQAVLHPVNAAGDAGGRLGTIDIIDLHNLTEKEVIVGRICKACGQAAVEFILKAAELAMNKEVSALVTAPINKEATRLAGCGELGHLELLARYTHSTDYATMLTSGPLRVVHLTTHYSLKEALTFVTKARILASLNLTHGSFQKWGIPSPRIAVAALNPHGGEGGILGREEIEEIFPAVQSAREAGIDARGPYPADSIFNRAINREFDVVIAMYHDQGHIPIKVYGFEKSVSVALGLPFIRTSVDHGTAFDIAGKGIAEAESMKEAIKAAVSLILARKL
jgi:4-phospho-D-threonate 3-dehydrogenase / 4-phospho-D-erythronate 3-dehydrogenase